MLARDHAGALNRLLAAAQKLLEAREDQMVTSEEWDELQRAVLEAQQLESSQSTE